jgi:hypothetical protein
VVGHLASRHKCPPPPPPKKRTVKQVLFGNGYQRRAQGEKRMKRGENVQNVLYICIK